MSIPGGIDIVECLFPFTNCIEMRSHIQGERRRKKGETMNKQPL